jgi:hypothetical protein
MAATATDRALVARLVERANGCLMLAETVGEDDLLPGNEGAAKAHQPIQQQQQPQQKKQDDET